MTVELLRERERRTRVGHLEARACERGDHGVAEQEEHVERPVAHDGLRRRGLDARDASRGERCAARTEGAEPLDERRGPGRELGLELGFRPLVDAALADAAGADDREAEDPRRRLEAFGRAVGDEASAGAHGLVDEGELPEAHAASVEGEAEIEPGGHEPPGITSTKASGGWSTDVSPNDTRMNGRSGFGGETRSVRG